MIDDPRLKTFALLLQRRRRLVQRLEQALVHARAALERAHSDLVEAQSESTEQDRTLDAHERRLVDLTSAAGGFSAVELITLRDYREVLVERSQALCADVQAAEHRVSERMNELAGAQRAIARNLAQIEALEGNLKEIAAARDLAVEDLQDEEAEEALGARSRANDARNACK